MIDNYMGPMPEDQYREAQRAGAIGGSGLTKILRLSVAHYLADLERMSERAAVTLGNVVHTAVLEPHLFAERYAVAPEVVKLDAPQARKVERPQVGVTTVGDWRVGGAKLADGSPAVFPTKAEAVAHAKTVGGWTTDGVTFHATRKAADAASGADKPWTLAGVADAPRFRTRGEAQAHAAEAADGREVISAATMAQCDEIALALRSHPVASALLEGARCEEVVQWHDAAHGVDCSGKLDAQAEVGAGLAEMLGIDPGRVGVDLKTTGKLAQPSRLGRMCYDAGWHIQAAHYMAGAAANAQPLTAWVNIVVETVAPYGVAVVVLDDAYLALGRYERGEALARVRQWRETGEAHGYDPAPVTIAPPAWALPAEVEGQEFEQWAAKGQRAERQREEAALAVSMARTRLDLTLRKLSSAAADAVSAARSGDYGRAMEYVAELGRHEAEAEAQRNALAEAEAVCAEALEGRR